MIKQSCKDGLTIESGQLGVYNIKGRLYLLREGYWVLEKSKEKALFHNLGKKGLVEENQVDLDPFEYDSERKPGQKTQKSKKISTSTHSKGS